MSVEKITARLREQQSEILEAIEARKGKYGKDYASTVRQAARSCAVMQASLKMLPEFEEPIRHATACVLAYGMNHILNLQEIPKDTIDEGLVEEFTSDVTVLTKYMIHRCADGELNS